MDIDLDPSDYSLDQRELGKLLFVASAAVFVVSAHSALKFRDSANELDKMNRKLDRVQGIMEGESFQESFEALSQRGLDEIVAEVDTAVTAFESASSSFNRSEQVQEDIESSYELYRWIVLTSIVGMTVGGGFMIV